MLAGVVKHLEERMVHPEAVLCRSQLSGRHPQERWARPGPEAEAELGAGDSESGSADTVT